MYTRADGTTGNGRYNHFKVVDLDGGGEISPDELMVGVRTYLNEATPPRAPPMAPCPC